MNDSPVSEATARVDLGALLRGSGEMLRDRQFVGYVLPIGFAFAINFGMLAGVPFILQDRLGFSPREFGLLVLMSMGGFSAGTLANNRLIGRVAPAIIVRRAGWCHVTALVVMAALSLSGFLAWWTIILPHVLLSFGTGIMTPTANAGAVSLYPRLAGTASSWVGLAQMGIGALGTVTVALLSLLDSRYVAMPLVVGLMPFAVASLLSARLLRPLTPRG